MQLYVCYGTFKAHHDHPCRTAHQALTGAGHRPKVVRSGGCYGSDPLWPRRRKVRRLTGNYKVPTLFSTTARSSTAARTSWPGPPNIPAKDPAEATA